MATGAVEDATGCALRNEIILRNIFIHLPLSDLKRCRIVSRNWNFQLGSYIRDFRCVNATIGGSRPCFDLQVLNDLVRRMNIVHINGLTINFGSSFHSDCTFNGDDSDDENGQNRPDPPVFYGDLIRRLPLKHLRITWKFMPEECPVLMFVITLFREKFQDLHSLNIDHFPHMFCTYFGHFGDYWTAPSLPKLKELHIVDMGIIESTSVRNFLLKVLNAAPNLEQLSGEMEPTNLGLLPDSKYSLLTNVYLRFTRGFNEEMKCLNHCTKLAHARPKLSKLVTNAPESWETEFLPGYFHALEQLLISSAETLEELTILPTIFPLCYLPAVLVNLKKLIIFTGSPPQQALTLLRSINYSKSLPALEYVELTAHGDLDSDPELFVNPWEGRQVEAAEIKSLTLKTLDLRYMDWTQFTFENLSSVFTNVTDRLSIIRFSFGTTYTIPVPYEDLWGHWPEVQAVELIEELRGNYDAEFLGIYPEEAHLLREMDDESLERLNIVPIRPSVLTRSGLRSLQLKFKARDDPIELNYIPEQLFLSKLTGILAFKKFQRMGIDLEIFSSKECELHLNHLRPFAKIVILEP